MHVLFWRIFLIGERGYWYILFDEKYYKHWLSKFPNDINEVLILQNLI